MKKILTILICLCMFLLCGCSVPTQYTLEQNENGEITQSIYVPFSVDELVSYGIDSETGMEIANEVKNKLDTKFLNRYRNFLTKLETDDGLTEIEKQVLKAYCPSESDMEGKGLLFLTSATSGITYEFKFKNVLAYFYFNTTYKYNELLEKLNKDDTKIVHNFLTTEKVSTGETIYSNEYEGYATLAQYINSTAKQILQNKIGSNTTLTDEQKNKIYDEVPPKDFLYRYGTPYKRLHSNADQIRLVNGIYYHEWTVDLDNPTREIATWRTYANQSVWYALALGASLVLVAVLMFVYRKDKKVA